MKNLATGKDADDCSIEDPLSDVLAILTNSGYTLLEKMRILLLYIFYLKGIPREEFDKLFYKAGIPISSASTITNLLHMDVDLFRPGSCKPCDDFLPERQEMDFSPQFKQSRWVPVLKTILLNCVRNELDEDRYPILNANKKTKLIPKTKDIQWSLGKQAESNISHLVVFIAGGVSYSEMRCAYEVVRKHPKWQIYVGGDSIITPNVFFEKLKGLHSFYAKDE